MEISTESLYTEENYNRLAGDQGIPEDLRGLFDEYLTSQGMALQAPTDYLEQCVFDTNTKNARNAFVMEFFKRVMDRSSLIRIMNVFMPVPGDLTSWEYGSVYTVNHLESLRDSLPWQFPDVGDDRSRELLQYILKRYLYQYISELDCPHGGEDEFCREEYDYDKILTLVKGDEGFLSKVTEYFLTAFGNQIVTQQDNAPVAWAAALARPGADRIPIAEDLTIAEYASLYTPHHLFVLQGPNSFPREEPFLSEPKSREQVRYVYKRYLYDCISPLLELKGVAVDRDAFCSRPYDYMGLCSAIGEGDGEEFFANVKESFLGAFSAQVGEQERVSGLPAKGGVLDLAEYCRRRLSGAEIVLLVQVLEKDRYFDVIHFAAKNGVYGTADLHSDRHADGPVYNHLRKKLRKGDAVLPFFASNRLVHVVEKLGDGKKGSRARQALAMELSRPGR
ncbi:hypothetical protein [Streptomyces wuyuanensis]|uniref:hypothetical protein n=1 Tax=Streptomyces wuyuanensis TaxID=1196353 RepID=UPI00343690A3